MRAGAGRDAARDPATINDDDVRTLRGKFVGGGYPCNTRADDRDIAFAAALKRCRARGYRNVHPKRFAAPVDGIVHRETRLIELILMDQTLRSGDSFQGALRRQT